MFRIFQFSRHFIKCLFMIDFLFGIRKIINVSTHKIKGQFWRIFSFGFPDFNLKPRIFVFCLTKKCVFFAVKNRCFLFKPGSNNKGLTHFINFNSHF